MAKRFRLRISRIIPSFHPCGSNSKEPSNPIPSFFRFSPFISTVLPKRRYSLKRHVSSAFGCCNRSKPTLSDDDRSESPPEFRWEKDKHWHVITTPNDVVAQTSRRKIYNSSAEDDDVLHPHPPPAPPPSAEKKKKRRAKKKKKTTSRTSRTVRFSTSSAESGLFSSEGFGDADDDDDEEEETETLVSSSRSFSSTSDSLETIRETAPDHYPVKSRSKKTKKKTTKKKKSAKRSTPSVSEELGEPESNETTPARLSVFQRLIPCSVEGKVRESFAVVKRSSDPYEDFKRSMMEMILEKQMFDDGDLEQLLHCFLSLNSKHHHGVIVQAFTEIWEALFCASSTRSSSASRRVSRAL